MTKKLLMLWAGCLLSLLPLAATPASAQPQPAEPARVDGAEIVTVPGEMLLSFDYVEADTSISLEGAALDSLRFGVTAKPEGAANWTDAGLAASASVIETAEFKIVVDFNAGDSLFYLVNVWAERGPHVAGSPEPARVLFVREPGATSSARVDSLTFTLKVKVTQ